MIEELEQYAKESKVDDLFRDLMTGCFKQRPSAPVTYILEYLANAYPEESLAHARAFVDVKEGLLKTAGPGPGLGPGTDAVPMSVSASTIETEPVQGGVGGAVQDDDALQIVEEAEISSLTAEEIAPPPPMEEIKGKADNDDVMEDECLAPATAEENTRPEDIPLEVSDVVEEDAGGDKDAEIADEPASELSDAAVNNSVVNETNVIEDIEAKSKDKDVEECTE